MAEVKKNKTQASKEQAPVYKPRRSFLDTTDAYFEKHTKTIFWLGLSLTCLFGLLLFDPKISEGTDDSGYIMAAWDFIKGKAFPTWHGSFYPIFLALPVVLFGLNLFVLKFFSYLLMTGHFVILYKTFENRVRPTILAFVTLLTAISSDILYFASSTFSEPLYFFLQALSLFYLFKIIDVLNTGNSSLKQNWKLWLLFGLFTFLFSITRNVGLGIVIAFLAFFVLNRQFKEVLYGIGSFLVFQIPYSLYKNIFWKQADIGFEGQFKVMFQKDAYKPALGNEDFMGFIDRYITNSDLYLSKHFFKILGWRAADSTATRSLLTIFMYALFILAFVIAFKKKNRYMQFLALYLPVAIGGTFIAQQISWDQARLIIVYIPLILIFITYGLYEISENKKYRLIQIVLFFFFIITSITTFVRTGEKVSRNGPIMVKQAMGKKYAGFTPDWVYFFQASEWAAKNLPKDAVIASRKPSMSFIYSKGRDFYGIYKIPDFNKDTVMNKFISRKADVLILDINELEQKGIPPALFEQLRPFNKAMFIGSVKTSPDPNVAPENKYFIVFEPTPDRKKEFVDALTKSNITIRTDLAAFNQELNNPNAQFLAEDADLLLKSLKDAGVKYMIVASIRANPKVADGNLVNTLHRYMNYIVLKYPNTFRMIQQFGRDDNEPSMIYEVFY